MRQPDVLECQGCGMVLRRLTNAEVQAMSRNPYHFVVFCNRCCEDGLWEQWQDSSHEAGAS